MKAKFKRSDKYGEPKFDHLKVVYKYPSKAADTPDSFMTINWYMEEKEYRKLHEIWAGWEEESKDGED